MRHLFLGRAPSAKHRRASKRLRCSPGKLRGPFVRDALCSKAPGQFCTGEQGEDQWSRKPLIHQATNESVLISGGECAVSAATLSTDRRSFWLPASSR